MFSNILGGRRARRPSTPSAPAPLVSQRPPAQARPQPATTSTSAQRWAAATYPLPSGWELAHTADNRPYYLDHNARKTTFEPPLPAGWEAREHNGRSYYVDHANQRTTWHDPREPLRLGADGAQVAVGIALTSVEQRASASAMPTAIARPVGGALVPPGPSIVAGLGGSGVSGWGIEPRELEEVDIPSAYVCSISGELMRDPVIVVGSGNTYERAEIARWLSAHSTDPLSNVPIPAKDQVLVPNVALRSAIDEFVQHLKGQRAKAASAPPAAPAGL